MEQKKEGFEKESKIYRMNLSLGKDIGLITYWRHDKTIKQK
jgi:hypothetical protein